ncbi:MAG: hypothetical protein JST54_06855 [Deltaproteobacteria bacterium]|nr:hypothetical protein [Deltaproteobacteria bacterium]
MLRWRIGSRVLIAAALFGATGCEYIASTPGSPTSSGATAGSTSAAQGSGTSGASGTTEGNGSGSSTGSHTSSSSGSQAASSSSTSGTASTGTTGSGSTTTSSTSTGATSGSISVGATSGSSTGVAATTTSTGSVTSGTSTTGSSASTAGSSGSSGSTGASGSTGGACPPGKNFVVDVIPTPLGDTVLVSGNGSTGLNFGQLTVANVSAGLGPQGSAGLFSFTLSPNAVTAFSTGNILSVELVVTRALQDAQNCGGGGCPASAGTLTANALRTDWTEGNGNAGSGATWDTVDGHTPWNGSGATGAGDIATPGIVVIVDATQPQVSFTLDGSDFSGLMGFTTVAVRVGASNGATFTIATKESSVYAAPLLQLTYCQ